MAVKVASDTAEVVEDGCDGCSLMTAAAAGTLGSQPTPEAEYSGVWQMVAAAAAAADCVAGTVLHWPRCEQKT